MRMHRRLTLTELLLEGLDAHDLAQLTKLLHMSFTGRRIAMGADGLQRQLSNYTPPGCSLGRGLTIADGVKLGVLDYHDGYLTVADGNKQKCSACGGTGFIDG